MNSLSKNLRTVKSDQSHSPTQKLSGRKNVAAADIFFPQHLICGIKPIQTIAGNLKSKSVNTTID